MIFQYLFVLKGELLVLFVSTASVLFHVTFLEVTLETPEQKAQEQEEQEQQQDQQQQPPGDILQE